MANEVKTVFQTEEFKENFGTVRIEEWPEGLVLWAGGRIRWKSFRPVHIDITDEMVSRSLAQWPPNGEPYIAKDVMRAALNAALNP